MKAMQYKRFGSKGRLDLGERSRPAAGPKQVVVRVSHSSVNPIDWKLQSTLPRLFLPFHFPLVPGFDLAGEVVEAGAEVTRFEVGQWVHARVGQGVGGGAAEYAVVGEEVAASLPKGMSARDAAAIPLAGLTALQSLRDVGGLRAGQRVLITGATGGVGHFAVQIAAAYGAHVTAVCSAANAALARELGADVVLDYHGTDDFKKFGPFDVIFDCVGKARFGSLARALSDRGVVISTLPSPGSVMAAVQWPLWSKRRARHITMRSRGADLEELDRLVEAGKLHPVVDSVYPLEDLRSAYEQSRGGHTKGKIVIEVCPECVPA